MKKSHFYSGLLLTPLPFSARYKIASRFYITSRKRDLKKEIPILSNCCFLSSTLSNAHVQSRQAVLSTIFENIRQIYGWSFNDLALLKAIKNNATRLRNIQRPDRKIIRLKD